ncbi:MAG: hypothetical protein OXG06_03700 [Gammaproteobacteria bacterium]|nr:hypothetical protein [Gammaproteobacteria bacterium]
MTQKPDDRVPVSFRLTREELDAMKAAAAEEMRSVSEWLRYHIVVNHLQKKGRSRG